MWHQCFSKPYKRGTITGIKKDPAKIYKTKITGQVQVNQYPGEEQLILKLVRRLFLPGMIPTNDLKWKPWRCSKPEGKFRIEN